MGIGIVTDAVDHLLWWLVPVASSGRPSCRYSAASLSAFVVVEVIECSCGHLIQLQRWERDGGVQGEVYAYESRARL